MTLPWFIWFFILTYTLAALIFVVLVLDTLYRKWFTS